MKKRLLGILLCGVLALACVGCGSQTYQEAISTSNKEDYGNGYFTVVTEWGQNSEIYRIVYDNDTNVKYLIVASGYQYGITPLYNTDGTLQIYEEE